MGNAVSYQFEACGGCQMPMVCWSAAKKRRARLEGSGMLHSITGADFLLHSMSTIFSSDRRVDNDDCYDPDFLEAIELTEKFLTNPTSSTTADLQHRFFTSILGQADGSVKWKVPSRITAKQIDKSSSSSSVDVVPDDCDPGGTLNRPMILSVDSLHHPGLGRTLDDPWIEESDLAPDGVYWNPEVTCLCVEKTRRYNTIDSGIEKAHQMPLYIVGRADGMLDTYSGHNRTHSFRACPITPQGDGVTSCVIRGHPDYCRYSNCTLIGCGGGDGSVKLWNLGGANFASNVVDPDHRYDAGGNPSANGLENTTYDISDTATEYGLPKYQNNSYPSPSFLTDEQAHKGLVTALDLVYRDSIYYLLSAGNDGVMKIWKRALDLSYYDSHDAQDELEASSQLNASSPTKKSGTGTPTPKVRSVNNRSSQVGWTNDVTTPFATLVDYTGGKLPIHGCCLDQSSSGQFSLMERCLSLSRKILKIWDVQRMRPGVQWHAPNNNLYYASPVFGGETHYPMGDDHLMEGNCNTPARNLNRNGNLADVSLCEGSLQGFEGKHQNFFEKIPHVKGGEKLLHPTRGSKADSKVVNKRSRAGFKSNPNRFLVATGGQEFVILYDTRKKHPAFYKEIPGCCIVNVGLHENYLCAQSWTDLQLVFDMRKLSGKE